MNKYLEDADMFDDCDEEDVDEHLHHDALQSEVIDSKREKKNLQTMELNTNKAGMEGLDTAKINDIIQKSSEGSKFYLHKQKCQERIDSKVAQLKREAQKITEEQIQKAEEEMSRMSLKIERKRDLSKTIVHIDMDMFFAAVEMRDDPSLKDKPMAVGGSSMLSTSNYAARKFGVRAAMPGFIGKKLCPELIIVPPNFNKYKEVSSRVQEIFEEYDPQFCPMSLDEAYLDITDYIQVNAEKYTDSNSNLSCAELIVQEIRKKIEAKTTLTASAGIAANTLLSKVCSDMNKPNGQYFLPPDKKLIEDFIKELPIRKISGIGNVTEQHLRALGVVTCSDLWTYRGLIRLLFSETSYRYFLYISMGIGSTHVTPAAERDRKSISTETTFSGTSDKMKLFKLCEELCKELHQDMIRKDFYGKVFTLKMKTTNFKVKTRAQSLMEYTRDEKVMINIAHKILSHEMDAESTSNGPLTLRLLGVRMSNLVEKSQHDTKKQTTLTEMFQKKSNQCPEENLECEDKTEDVSILDSVKETDFKESDEYEESSSSHIPSTLNEISNTNNHSFNNEEDYPTAEKEEDLPTYTCPVCSVSKFNDVEMLNKHIDTCLNLETVHKLVKESNSGFGHSEPGASTSHGVKTANIKPKRKSTANQCKGSKKQKTQPNSVNTLYKYLELQ